MKNIIKQIIANHGYITDSDLPELVKECPELPVVIKWCCAPRSCHMVKDVASVIRNAEKISPDDYVREIFLSASQLDTLRMAM